MKNYVLAVALFAATGVVFAVAGVSTRSLLAEIATKPLERTMYLRPRGRLAVLPLIATSPDQCE
jgi:hypothetical protein